MIAMEIDDRALKILVGRAKKTLNEKTLLNAIGARHLRWVNENFVAEGSETPWAPLSPNTVAGRRKGSDKVLQDTGRLRQSFTSFGVRVSGRHVDVGTESQIAEFHHRGTRPYTILPRRAKFLRFITIGGIRFARKVRHPGLPRRPLLPSRALGASLGVDVVEATVRKLA